MHNFMMAPMLPTAQSTDDVLTIAKTQRGYLLLATDWTQLPDVPQSTKDKYVSYRQALRDITLQPGFPTDITWPVAPTT